MLLAFHSSAAMFISVLVTLFTGILTLFRHDFINIPMPMSFALIILSVVGLMTLLTSVPKLYTETVKRCNDDIDGFVREQKHISGRCWGKAGLKVRLNLIFGLIAHERFDDAERLLMQTAPYIEKKASAPNKIQYLMDSLWIYRHRGDYDTYSYTLDKLLNEIQNNFELFPLERVEYGNLAELHRLETAFFTRTPEQLARSDREIAEKLNFLARIMLSQEHFNDFWDEYMTIHFNYLLGTTYIILGDARSADFYLGTVASQPCTYPETQRARQFLQTNNIQILF